MMPKFAFILLLAVFNFALVCCDVTVLSSVQTIYTLSPKLRVRCLGIDNVDADHIHLDIAPPLFVNQDYTIEKDEDGLLLHLQPNKMWINNATIDNIHALVLNSVTLGTNDNVNVLVGGSVILAWVLSTPTLFQSNQTIFMTKSNELRINGTGLVGAKKVDLYFDPPLFKTISYEMVSVLPLSSPTIILRLRHGYEWRTSPGMLAVVGIDTGGGPVRLGVDTSEQGVVVANVAPDTAFNGVIVTDSSFRQLYHDSLAARVRITGSNFNPQSTVLRFKNGLLEGADKNYTFVSITPFEIVLALVPGSFWIAPGTSTFPTPLTLLAVNIGAGFVAVGEGQGVKKGSDVATVFERPLVHSASTQLFMWHSHELHITGRGFRSGLEFLFSSEIMMGIDYTMERRTDAEVILTLREHRRWSNRTGLLYITHVSTCLGDDCLLDLRVSDLPTSAPGVPVANILEDPGTATSVEFFPSGTMMYQSGGGERAHGPPNEIEVNGRNLNTITGLVFSPAVSTSRYQFYTTGSSVLHISLNPGQKWFDYIPPSTDIFVTSTRLMIVAYDVAGGSRVSVHDGDGVIVANIIPDPVVFASTTIYHETQSKIITITGTGLRGGAIWTLQPTPLQSYIASFVNTSVIKLRLRDATKSWLPHQLSLSNAAAGATIPLMLTSVDTGGGMLTLNPAVQVGTVVADIAGVFCDDSCEFAFDGVCDDGSGYSDDGSADAYYSSESSYGSYYSEHTPTISACMPGTDCTDCGGVAGIDGVVDPASDNTECNNACIYARDNVCDDPRGTGYCILGSDCQDCGPVGASNSSMGGVSVDPVDTSIVDMSLSMSLLAPALSDEHQQSYDNLRMPYVILALQHLMQNLHLNSNVPPFHIWGLNIVSIQDMTSQNQRHLHLFLQSPSPFSSPSSSPGDGSGDGGTLQYRVYRLDVSVSMYCDLSWVTSYSQCPAFLQKQQERIASTLSNTGFNTHPSVLLNFHNFLNDAYKYVYGQTSNVIVVNMESTFSAILSSDVTPRTQGMLTGAFIHWTPYMASDSDMNYSSGGSQDHTLEYIIPCSVFFVCALCLVKYNYSKLRAFITGEEEEEDIDFEMELVEEGRRAGNGVRTKLKSVAAKPLLGSSGDDSYSTGEDNGERNEKRSRHRTSSIVKAVDGAYSSLHRDADRDVEEEEEDLSDDENVKDEVQVRVREEVDL